MSFDTSWDIDSYREEHESSEHWDLRRCFMERWKNDFSEERLVCLARVFANIELLGCRYPNEVMQEVAKLSHDVAKEYRNSRKDKLKRTFVSASDAAEDRARGVKREGGVIKDAPAPKNNRIQFIPQGQKVESDGSDNENGEKNNHNNSRNTDNNSRNTDNNSRNTDNNSRNTDNNTRIPPNTVNKPEKTSTSEASDPNAYQKELEAMKCANVRSFHPSMFNTFFGRMVLIVRPWTNKLGNIQSSTQVCNVALGSSYENGIFSLTLNGKLLAQASGSSKSDAKNAVEILAWNRLRQEVISVLMKEQFIAQGDSRISMSDVTQKKEEFGTPIENSVATKMMKLMGWKGGGLGADAQGIAEPIKPHLQMVNRAGLGSQSSDISQLRKAASRMMQRYIQSDTLDVDLVFSSEFTKEERAALHQVAQKAGLASRSYGVEDRFLVVKKKLDPFSLVRAVVEKGGNTPKYQVFIPAGLQRRR